MANDPAVQLFVQSAARIRPDFRLTPGNARAEARICALAVGCLAPSGGRPRGRAPHRPTRSQASWRAGWLSISLASR